MASFRFTQPLAFVGTRSILSDRCLASRKGKSIGSLRIKGRMRIPFNDISVRWSHPILMNHASPPAMQLL